MSGHGGNLVALARQAGCRPGDILDFSANINPLGPPSCLRRVINKALADLVHYPDPDCSELKDALARLTGLEPDCIHPGNGTSELLFRLPRVLSCKRAVIPVPSYIDYGRACRLAGLEVLEVPLQARDGFRVDLELLDGLLDAGDLLILGLPNNPTGQMVDEKQLRRLIADHPETYFLLDEAFAGFVPHWRSPAGISGNVIVLRSLTKIFALPGLRLGYLAGSAELCTLLKKQSAPWSVNTLAQAVGTACCEETGYLEESRSLVSEERGRLRSGIKGVPGLVCYPGEANFLLVRSEIPRMSGRKIMENLLAAHRIAVRCCDNYQGLDSRYFRIAVRTRTENQRLLDGLGEILGVARPGKKSRPRKKPALMLVGTGSDVGKSVLVAGLGRILVQDGIRVAPFKAQNMSLNSYVTRDGGEMGRAQVVQAQACRLDPDVRMNPVLLKPSSDVGSQVIVNGRSRGNMKVLEYVSFKQELRQTVCASYDELAEDFDVMLLEGAGSPGEVNLKSHDIVNMRMAQYAEAAVLLVGDIDRGGVYASFVGHWQVMEEWERRLLAGFLVNRFRGDASLLADAHAYLHEQTGRPVLGVVPYLADLGLPQEDSVSFKAGLFAGTQPSEEYVEVAVIDLPHISNFTDIEPFFDEPDVYLRIIDSGDALGRPDAVILPGSKNVPADIRFLKQSGLADGVRKAAEKGSEIVGICGGYQMLGQRVGDPFGIEGVKGEVLPGLGLIDMETTLAADKTLTRKQGRHLASGCPVHGYEIHHGITRGDMQPVLRFDDGSVCGQAAGNNSRIWGSYLHGIFDSDLFRRHWINQLRITRGLEPLASGGAIYDLEPAFDRLADSVREHVDLEAVYALLGL